MRDFDEDGDIDVMYVRGNSVYIKNHQSHNPEKNFINDRIRTYSLKDVFEIFFATDQRTQTPVSRYARFLNARGQMDSRISARLLDDESRSHVRWTLRENIFAAASRQSDDNSREYIYDMLHRKNSFTQYLGDQQIARLRSVPAVIESMR
jgi:hypothetical protein